MAPTAFRYGVLVTLLLLSSGHVHCRRATSSGPPPPPSLNFLPYNVAEVALQGVTTAAFFGGLAYAGTTVVIPTARALKSPSRIFRLAKTVRAEHTRGLSQAVRTGVLFGSSQALVTTSAIVGARHDRGDLISSGVLYAIVFANRLRQGSGGLSLPNIITTFATASFTLLLLEGPHRNDGMIFTDINTKARATHTRATSTTRTNGGGSGGGDAKR